MNQFRDQNGNIVKEINGVFYDENGLRVEDCSSLLWEKALIDEEEPNIMTSVVVVIGFFVVVAIIVCTL